MSSTCSAIRNKKEKHEVDMDFEAINLKPIRVENAEAKFYPEIPINSENTDGDVQQIDNSYNTSDGKCKPEETFDDLLELAGGGGLFQLLVVFITSWIALGSAMDIFVLVFKMDEPDHWCVRMQNGRALMCDAGTTGCQLDRCDILPFKNTTTATTTAAINTTTTVMSNGSRCVQWAYNHSTYISTVATDFDLVCSDAYLRSLAISVHMLSGIVGAFSFGLIGDRYGRLRASLVSSLMFVVIAPVVSVMPNTALFLLATSGSAATHIGMYVCLFTLGMEMVGERWRSTAGMFWMVPWALGIMLTALSGWLFRNWTHLQLVSPILSVPLVPACIFWLPESPRWLSIQGRHEEALAVLKKIARINRRQLPDDILSRLKTLPQSVTATSMDCFREAKLLFGSRRMCNYTLSTIWIWIIMAVVYYGISFDAAQLASDAYIATCLAGLVELPSLLAIPMMNIWGRRTMLAACYFITAASILLVPAVPSGVPILILGLIGKLSIGSGFGIIYIFLEEYMPTEVRNAALGLSTMAEGIGGAISPHVAFGLGSFHPAAPSVLFGVVAITAGLVCLLLLPETMGKPMPTTVHDVEKLALREKKKDDGKCNANDSPGCRKSGAM